jgi:hypothetical protein
LLLCLARPPFALGQTDTDDAIRVRKNVLALNVGLGSAVGYLGATYAHEPLEFLQLEGGVGLGFSGLQLSAMPKLVICGGSNCFISGAGVSLSFPTSTAAKGLPTWLNVDAVGYEYRSASGTSFFCAAGFGVGLGGGQACTGFIDCGDPTPNVRGHWFMQTRVGVGYWY